MYGGGQSLVAGRSASTCLASPCVQAVPAPRKANDDEDADGVPCPMVHEDSFPWMLVMSGRDRTIGDAFASERGEGRSNT